MFMLIYELETALKNFTYQGRLPGPSHRMGTEGFQTFRDKQI